jgi:hypothetical protein
MTDDPTVALPDTVYCTQSFMARLPAQRMIDLLGRLEPGVKFGELMESQPPRITAFRALLRQFPERDATSLWMHAYDVEVALVDEDPTNGKSPTPSPPSVPSTT